MYKLLLLTILLAVGRPSVGQQTFSDKQEAFSWLKNTLISHFIENVKYKGGSYTCSLEFTDNAIIFSTTLIEPFRGDNLFRIGETDTLKLEEYSSIIALSYPTTCLQISTWELKAKNANDYMAIKYVYIPMNIAESDNALVSSIDAAFDFIVKAIKQEKRDLAKEASDLLKVQKFTESNGQSVKGQLPGFTLITTNGLEVNMMDYIRANRKFKDRPTLFITWASWCPPCYKLIDVLLNNDLTSRCNVVLVNKDLNALIPDLITQASKRSPDYSKETIMLFDQAGQLAPLDGDATPYFIWFDENMVIHSLFQGFDIGSKCVERLLGEIDH